MVYELEKRLKTELFVDWITITNNGTIPLQIALKLLGKEGEIITTPFSYVATTSSIVWENCAPIFVDIDPDFLTIDECKIEEVITDKTTCILATHVFGNPCNVKAIEKIAKKHGLFVIYDAAHCFGVKYLGESIFDFGDVSTCSFHATKLFHTAEGGAMFCKDKELQKKLYYSHNFGHNGPNNFQGLGINAKISELQAAMGLSVLPHMNKILKERKNIVNYYNNNITFKNSRTFRLRENTEWNYSYYPIIFDSVVDLEKVISKMNELNIFPRRYFSPSLNTLNYVKPVSMPVSESISDRILCLPLYVGLQKSTLTEIVEIVNE